MRFYLLWLAVAATTCAPLPAGAIPIVVSSYTMKNGDAGSYNYRDFTYLPCPSGDCNVNNALLSGGTGKLTDGVLPTASWNLDGASSTWVGWETSQSGLDPTIAFYFASTVTIEAVSVWADNTPGNGSVMLPASVSIDGQSFNVTPDSTSGPRWLTFSGLNITGNSVSLQLFQASGFSTYMMVGEVAFDGSVSPAAPEPGTWALIAAGLGLVGLQTQRTNIIA